jgi:ABC-type Na+ efflux pump permease subunit
MRQFWHVFLQEYRMSVRRKGIWLAYLAWFVLYAATLDLPEMVAEWQKLTPGLLWAFSGVVIYELNMFAPLLGGIGAADRMARDRYLKMEELLHSTPLGRRSYILGKYVGALASMLTPLFLFEQMISIYLVIQGVSPQIFLFNLASFFLISLPAYAFVIAFSVVCPLVIPLRVYQVLFTGYWFWGNFLNPGSIPTLADTWLMPSGKIVLEGWYRITVMVNGNMKFSSLDAAGNLLTLAVCIGAVLWAAEGWLSRKAREA